MGYEAEYYFVDLDGTLVNPRPGAMAPGRLLHGNFLFPIIRDLMVKNGWPRERAETAIADHIREQPFWDYPDFMAEFGLPAGESHRRFRAWHRDNLIAVDKTVQLVRDLRAAGKKLLVLSNNPHSGCCWKVEAAGLGDGFGSPYFHRILGTDQMRGCKGAPGVWERALARIPAPPSAVGVIGDNPVEDGEIPRSLGVAEIHLIAEHAN